MYTSFDLERGLMTESSGGMAYPHPAAASLAGALPQLRMLGALLGKALFEGILLDVPLAHFFVARLQVSDGLSHACCFLLQRIRFAASCCSVGSSAAARSEAPLQRCHVLALVVLHTENARRRCSGARCNVSFEPSAMHTCATLRFSSW